MFRTSKQWAPLPLRIMLGSLGVPAPEMTAWLVGLAEIVGGLALIAGALVAIASVVLIVDMVVAMFMVHLPHGFNFINITGMGKQGPVFGMPGAEVNLLYIAGLLALVIVGAGEWSVDALLQDRKGPSSRPA